MASRVQIQQQFGLWCVTWVEPRHGRPCRFWQWHRSQTIAYDHAGELIAQASSGAPAVS